MRERRRPSSTGAAHGRALRALLACGVLALALALLGGAPAQAQAPAKVLVFHGPVADPTTDPGVAALEAIGAERGFTVEATGDPATISAEGLEGVSAVVFLNTAGDLLDDEQEGALESFIDDGGGFLGIGSAAQSEPDTEYFDGLIGARPSADSSDGPVRPDRGLRRPGAPGDRGSPAPAGAHRRLVPVDRAPDRQGPHRGALPRARRARRRRHRRRRHRPSHLLVPRLPRRPLVLHRHGPHRRQLRRGGRSAPTSAARSSGPPAWCAATARRRSTAATRARRSWRRAT